MLNPHDFDYRNPLPDSVGYWWLEDRIVQVTRIYQHSDGRRILEYYCTGDETVHFARNSDTDWERVIPRSRPAQSDAPPTPQ